MTGTQQDDSSVAWSKYFPNEPYSPDFPYLPRLRDFKKYFRPRAAVLLQGALDATHSAYLDFEQLVEDFAEENADFPIATDLKDQPDIVLRSMSLALHQVMYENQRRQQDEAERLSQQQGTEPPEFPPVPKMTIRLLNHGPVTPLRHLKAGLIGKLVSLRGTVVRTSSIKPLITQLAFVCQKCRAEQVRHQPDGKYTPPTSCETDDCRSRSFTPDRVSPDTKAIDCQHIRVQEIIMDDARESGRIPRTVECETSGDIVDMCLPGDIVTVTGEVKVVATNDAKSKNKKEQAMFLLYLQVNAIANNRKKQSLDGNDAEQETEFSEVDLYCVQEIQKEENLFRFLVNSLCPAIYGHELVKAGLTLAVFGGCQKYTSDRNRIPVRGDPHLLVVGDPGLGKSQMLHAVSNVAPRSVFVCGNTTTTAGLTVTLHKDGSSGDYALEAGALVLADQGCCCIDEFDKMGAQHNALLEAMEQQCVSIAKAGVVCSLPARTSIMAAANPVGGHYNKAKTVSENLKLNGALLSRFDLVFILLDEADAELDRVLSEHVMSLHSSHVRGRQRPGHPAAAAAAPAAEGADATLAGSLRIRTGEEFDPLPPQLFRKYVSYARTYVRPKISPEAALVLQAFYIELRHRHQNSDSTPITTRQLESLVRLSEARARLELREVVTKEDAEDVVEIMQNSLHDTFSDEYGQMDFQRSQLGSGMSKKAQAKRFIAKLNRIAETNYDSIFTKQELRQTIEDLGLKVGSSADFIGSLNNQGYLLKKAGGRYQLQTTDF